MAKWEIIVKSQRQQNKHKKTNKKAQQRERGMYGDTDRGMTEGLNDAANM